MRDPSAIADLVSSVGMFLSAIAVVLSNRAARSSGKAARAIETSIEPNHGSSVKDALKRIETLQNSQGHQIGELRRDFANHIQQQADLNNHFLDRL